MSTPHDPADRPELTEAEERQVSALLADLAAAPMTVPPEVVTRLEEALAGLVTERTSGSGTVVPIASRNAQRRRGLSRALLAAAAVVVGGYAVGNLAWNGTLAGGGSDSTASDAGGSAGGSTGDVQAEQAAPGSGVAPEAAEMLLAPTVRPGRLAADVSRVVRLFETRSPNDDPRGDVLDGTRECPVPRLTEDQRLYEVRFRGDRAGMVLTPAGPQRVDVTIYSCLDGGVRLTQTLPAP